MKKLMILSMIVLGSMSFARDFEYNEKRDIVKPLEENVERMNRYTPAEWKVDKEFTKANIEKYSEFHEELDRADLGEDSER